MRKSTMIPLALVALFAACDENPVGPSGDDSTVAVAPGAADPLLAVNRDAFTDYFEWTDVIDNCEESVELAGTFKLKGQGVTTDSGFRTFLVHFVANADGTGLTSGARYVWRDTDSFHIATNIGNGFAPYVERETQNTHLIGQGGAPNLEFKYRFQLTWNAQDELIVDRESFEASCR